MELNLRPERPEEQHEVELLIREAFWGYFRPVCDEHYLAHLLRESPAFVPELDVVAEQNGRLVGNVLYSRASITDRNDRKHGVLTFGPLSVLPEYWNCGVGSALMRHTIQRAKQLGYPTIVLHGHPDYYPRFGFQSAKLFGITNGEGESYDALMAMELFPGALNGVAGRFEEDPVFCVSAEEAVAYDAENFPHKEPAVMLPVGLLLEKLPGKAQQAFRSRNIMLLNDLNRFSGRELLCWEGMDVSLLPVVNMVLSENHLAPKLLPGCEILERAKRGACL